MHNSFRMGFEKISEGENENRTTFNPRTFGAFTLAGGLGGLGESLVASKPSLKRALTMGALGATMGMTEGAQLGPDAPTALRVAKAALGTGLGGGIAYTASHGLKPGTRALATGLGALAAGIPASL